MVRKTNVTTNETLHNQHEILTAAIEGLQIQQQRLVQQIETLQAYQRTIHGPTTATGNQTQAHGTTSITRKGPTTATRGKISPEARAKMAAAQQKRWANYRRQGNGPESVRRSRQQTMAATG